MDCMTDSMKLELKENETLLWSGKPDAFTVFDKVHKKHYLITIIICSIIDVALIALYTSYALSHGTGIKIPVLLIINACCLVPALDFISVVKKIRTFVYCFTDQRIIQFSENAKAKDIAYSDITVSSIAKDSEGISSLLIGKKPLKASPRKRRALSVAPATPDEIPDIVLYALPGEAEEVLRKYSLLPPGQSI